jgi:hypothetical protein
VKHLAVVRNSWHFASLWSQCKARSGEMGWGLSCPLSALQIGLCAGEGGKTHVGFSHVNEQSCSCFKTSVAPWLWRLFNW